MRIATILNINQFFIVAALIYVLGCAGEPVRPELPFNHPANPQATETAYTAIPNPFEDSTPMTGIKRSESSSMPHKMHEKSDVQDLTQEQNDVRIDSENSIEKTNKKAGHQH
jgi:hypothetical protein